VSRRFWSPLAERLTPYVPGEQPPPGTVLKLNTNECPYPPSPRVLEAIRGVSGEELLRYPDPGSVRLCAAAAERCGLEPSQVFAGNGSDEILAHCFAALLNRPGGLLFPDITDSFCPVWAAMYEVSWNAVPLREDFTVAPEDYDPGAAAVLLPNPNAPTGIALPLAALREMLTAAPDRLLVVDEAYVDFGADSAVALIAEHDNLLVIQTFSKARSLAGLRVGLAFGQAELIEALRRVKDSFNSYPVDCVAERAAVAALEDGYWSAACCERVAGSREWLRAELAALDFEVLPSAANFLFARHRTVPGAELFAELRDEGVLLRRWDQPRIADFLRISVGTDVQCETVVEALQRVLARRGVLSSAPE
jgi:histidinol-phosphate aminotransferase